VVVRTVLLINLGLRLERQETLHVGPRKRQRWLRNSTRAFDKYAPDPKEATKADRKVDEKLKAGIISGPFPASDPPSATQPSPSKYDEGKE